MSSLSSLPLCVDLDGTLINSDLFLETLLLLIKRNVFYLFLTPYWLWRGKAALKAEVARRVTLNPEVLPYNSVFLDWLMEQSRAGRPLWLCTAANHHLAELVARHLGIFAGVLASSDTENLSGHAKAAHLVRKFGERAFDYCGNHRVDLAVWQVSQGAIVVNGSTQLEAEAQSIAELRATFPKAGQAWHAFLRALRLHQWTKNALLFVPLVAAHQLDDTAALLATLVAFLAFGLCASSVYLLNDLLDLEADRLHPHKKRRPFAAGDLSLLVGCWGGLILLVGAALLSLQLPVKFQGLLAGYYVLTVAYSFGLKRIVLVDTLALALLYTIRIVAGAAVTEMPLSFWLLLFAVFLFLSLALVKRYAELAVMQQHGKLEATGRGYQVGDLPILHSIGTAAGYLCVLVLALYINTPAVKKLYHHPQVIGLLCVLLLYWISRMWLKAHRGIMHDDPLIFAFKDRISLGIAVLAALTVFMAV